MLFMPVEFKFTVAKDLFERLNEDKLQQSHFISFILLMKNSYTAIGSHLLTVFNALVNMN